MAKWLYLNDSPGRSILCLVKIDVSITAVVSETGNRLSIIPAKWLQILHIFFEPGTLVLIHTKYTNKKGHLKMGIICGWVLETGGIIRLIPETHLGNCSCVALPSYIHVGAFGAVHKTHVN
jgi:hypothetical protein